MEGVGDCGSGFCSLHSYYSRRNGPSVLTCLSPLLDTDPSSHFRSYRNFVAHFLCSWYSPQCHLCIKEETKVRTCACRQVRHHKRLRAQNAQGSHGGVASRDLSLVKMVNSNLMFSCDTQWPYFFPICRQYLRILELVATGGWMLNFVQQEHVLILWSHRFASGLGCSSVNRPKLLVTPDGDPRGGAASRAVLLLHRPSPCRHAPSHAGWWAANVNRKWVSQKYRSFTLRKVTPKVRRGHPSDYLSVATMGQWM